MYNLLGYFNNFYKQNVIYEIYLRKLVNKQQSNFATHPEILGIKILGNLTQKYIPCEKIVDSRITQTLFCLPTAPYSLFLTKN